MFRKLIAHRSLGNLAETRENNLDAIRLLLAVAVIFSHAYALTGFAALEPLSIFTATRTDVGKLAVNAFFVISGFLITDSWFRSHSLTSFTGKRLRRIYPGYISCFLVCSFVVIPLGGAGVPDWLFQRDTYQFIYRPLLFRHIWSVQSAFVHNPAPNNVNGSIWSIRFEMMCYIMLAVIGLAGILRNRICVLILFLLSVAYFRLSLSKIDLPYFDYLDELPRLVAYFLAGVTAFVWRKDIPHSPILFATLLVVLVFSRGRSINLLWPIAFSYCILYLGFLPELKLRLPWKGTDISYGVYLYAFPIQQLLICYFPRLSPLVNFAIATPLALLAGFASWHGVEKRFLKRSTVLRHVDSVAAVPSHALGSVPLRLHEDRPQ